MRVARNQIDVAGHSGTVIGGEGIVAHGVVLSVIPQRGDGVAVVIVHDGRAVRGAASAHAAGRLRVEIHEPGMLGLLLGRVTIIHIAGVGIGRAKPRWIGRASYQAPTRRMRIGTEVVIESSVLWNDDHYVLDRSARTCATVLLLKPNRGVRFFRERLKSVMATY